MTKTVTVESTQTTTNPSPPLAQTDNTKFFGTPISLTKLDANRYLLVLKPEFFLVGVTANVVFAQQQGTACAPLSCPGVDDDRLVLPAGHQQLSFVLPATTTGTVLTLSGEKMHTTTISSAQLAALVGGAKKPHLIEPLDSGLWLTIDIDTIKSFAQQFQP